MTEFYQDVSSDLDAEGLLLVAFGLKI